MEKKTNKIIIEWTATKQIFTTHAIADVNADSIPNEWNIICAILQHTYQNLLCKHNKMKKIKANIKPFDDYCAEPNTKWVNTVTHKNDFECKIGNTDILRKWLLCFERRNFAYCDRLFNIIMNKTKSNRNPHSDFILFTQWL